LCHRSDLHDALKCLASGEGAGKPAIVHLGCETLSCDADAGTLTLQDGQVHHADVNMGADGIHSAMRTSILGYVQTALPSGRAVFRCLMEMSKMAGRPEFDWLMTGLAGPRGVRALP
ncbi:hypothetical protein B0H15DRAFT_759564, partial [Mycena belliarum]